ncbi:MAG: class I SAM-dependent methyltransferase [Bacteroidota bacterium]|nr:class I SAM-dependent methyltransferase [Bacteroidota bacterium]
MSSERQLLESEGRWWGEHVHRYRQAIKYIEPGNNVLDIACGTGFGTDILASHTNGKVIGGDISAGAIEECKRHWNKPNIEFRVLDGTALEFNDHYFDVIVSFETIEHTTSYAKMLAEFSRVLKPGGRLILSTPNAAITSPDGVIHNPYHTQEFHYDELKELLAGVFPSPQVYGQRYSRYDKSSAWKKIGNVFEKIMLAFGVRKLPYGLRSGFMKFCFGYPLYPRADDFLLEDNVTKIKQQAPVLFAVCKK